MYQSGEIACVLHAFQLVVVSSAPDDDDGLTVTYERQRVIQDVEDGNYCRQDRRSICQLHCRSLSSLCVV